MKTTRLSRSFCLAAIATLLATGLPAAEDHNTIKFSDPGKPGTVKISLGRGELQVQGADTTEVTVRADAKAVTSKPRKDNLRVLSAAASYTLQEKDNVVKLDAAAHDWGRGNGDFKLTVPRNTTVIVQNAWGGDITCAGISGDLEINCMHGEIRLDDVSGGAVVSTMNGEIRANIRELREGKPLSFTSMNGEVVLRVAPDAKANVRLRTQNGTVLTDFEESVLVTKVESSPSMPRISKSITISGRTVISAEIQESIREAAKIGATAVRQAFEAVRDGLADAKLDSDQARRDLDKAKRDLERAQRDAERERSRASRSADTPPAPAVAPTAPGTPGTPAPASKPAPAPFPPKIPSPTITGGKLVTGTLNGGGPEISVSTMNGDVTLRKWEAKK